MQHEDNRDEQKAKANPQENEKDTNYFGKVFEKVFGNFDGDNSLSEEESKLPGKNESLKDVGSSD